VAVAEQAVASFSHHTRSAAVQPVCRTSVTTVQRIIDFSLFDLWRHFWGFGPKIWDPKTTIFDDFETQWQIWGPVYRARNTIETIGKQRWKPWGVAYIVSGFHELWSTNGRLKIGPLFLPAL